DLAGVSRKTVYNHFDGKTALIDGAATLWTGNILAKLQIIADDDSLPFVAKLNAIVEHAYAELKFGSQAPGGKTRVPGLESLGIRRELRTAFTGFIQGIVRDAIEEGLVRREFDERRLTFAIVNVIGGLTIMDDLDGEAFTKVDILKDSLKAFVGGILTSEGAEAMRGSPLFE
ncbi:MAG: TetR/AcrR family transcriptional regulator, partial [Spirochaetales bacterium]|nr:TetR/AcrR family transcriptional regulator [Spirochaetales bacterium]